MRKVELGKTGEQIPVLGQGTWGIKSRKGKKYYDSWKESLRKGIELGLTRWCHWNGQQACTVGWGSANSEGVHSCCDDSAKENCRRIVKVPLGNLDKQTIKWLKCLGDVE